MLTRARLLLFGILISQAHGQLRPDIAAKLRSENWMERAEAYNALTQQKGRSPEEDRALVALLLKENAFRQTPAGAHPDPDDIDDGPFVEYVSSLEGTVQEIAQRNPGRADVWPALLGSGYGAPSELTRFFAAHADKTAPYFLAAAEGKVSGANKPDIFVALAQIMSYERDPATSHHLSTADVQFIERTIRQGLEDADIPARMGALAALGMIGNADDLKFLDQVAATDPTFDSEQKYYPIRISARAAADALRRRLSQANPHQ